MPKVCWFEAMSGLATTLKDGTESTFQTGYFSCPILLIGCQNDRIVSPSCYWLTRSIIGTTTLRWYLSLNTFMPTQVGSMYNCVSFCLEEEGKREKEMKNEKYKYNTLIPKDELFFPLFIYSANNICHQNKIYQRQNFKVVSWMQKPEWVNHS